ncbi:MAG: HAD hydrolase-like protein [Candidatus Thiodiazotropha sp. (ex Monitilora ramsayi)]|nr:HAD hydrolase-like protein [Candidatus Thiodiazotropha sp. (ex Monitilora ramsayi)]
MPRKFFVDFDGTLIDSRARLFNLFEELAPDNNLSFDAYWKIKRKRTNQEQMLRNWLYYSDSQIKEFKKMWLHRVEEPERLAMDSPIPGAVEFLKKSSKLGKLYLVTARQHPQYVYEQLSSMKMNTYFEDVYVTEQKVGKSELILSNTQFEGGDVFIGDSGEDILCGKELNLKTVAVTTGVLNNYMLKQYEPTMIVNSVEELDLRNV